MPTLSATGNTPIAYKLLLNDTFPSWGYSIKHGATTIWERWDGWTEEHGFQDPGMNSFAHYSFGAVARWMFQTVAGIDMAEPGFQRLLIHPQPAEGLTWVKASYGSIHGRIATEWKTADGRLTVTVSIPANTTATVVLPAADPATVTESGKADRASGGREASRQFKRRGSLGNRGRRVSLRHAVEEVPIRWRDVPLPERTSRSLSDKRAG